MNTPLNKAQSALETLQTARGNAFYPLYHLAPPAGWMNDPNGLIYHNGLYHAFYQHHPFDENWGPMHWGHATSRDMVRWEHQPIALAPGDEWDLDGCFSGSAVDDNGVLSLIYTGHIWLEGAGNDSAIRQVQCLATSEDGVHFKKQGVILTPPPGIMHFRDPKVWQQDGVWWMVIGARDEHDRGKVLLYRGNSLRDWQLDRILAEANADMGYMWECPDFFPLGNSQILMFSPQGIKAKGLAYQNLFQSGYLRGRWQPGKGFTVYQPFEEMDHGHDFYAPQSFVAEDGRRIVLGWMDMWESPMPSKREGWAGCLTVPRELCMMPNGKLYQNPVHELATLRTGEQLVLPCVLNTQEQMLHPNAEAVELEIAWEAGQSTAERYGIRLGQGCELFVDALTQRLVLSRGYQDAQLDGDRSVPLSENADLHLRIFIDRSSIEVFVNQGEYCLSSRLYPQPGERQLELFASHGKALCRGGTLWQLNAL
ncbi:glycoside hydrolase family 32 protein [Enterobacter sp. Ap-1006]|uniref:glycoside hydrolase family 32 protein n=1 Tax=Enterobacter sp. Ap-1006 TaxID=2608345 RepID=UPI001423BD93|nr:glycoside hydrolase family 32 protein [Enterobacter sp. Ap-1006]NIF46308.1 glycoside hydrolase family 32 protein [Enterobacter sp. Ap-1006]